MFRASRNLENPFVDQTPFDEWNLYVFGMKKISYVHLLIIFSFSFAFPTTNHKNQVKV
jgi:hypothetical protein